MTGVERRLKRGRVTSGLWTSDPAWAAAVEVYRSNLLAAVWRSGDRTLQKSFALEAFLKDDGDLVKGPTALVKFARWMRATGRQYPQRAGLVSGSLGANLGLLGEVLGLNELEREIIQLVILARSVDALGDLLGTAGSLGRGPFLSLASEVLAVPVEEVSRAFDPSGRLAESALVQVDGMSFPFLGKIDMSSTVSNLLESSGLSRETFIAALFPTAAPPTLGLDDFAHLRREVSLLVQVLRGALDGKAKGVNVLLYGPTGVGKTELAALAARELGVPMYESCAIHPPDANAQQRLGAVRFAQRCLSGSRALIVFDEFEDAFGYGPDARPSKLGFNRLLERNTVPTVWMSNEVASVDPALLRRFTYSIELPAATAGVRRRVLDRHLGADRARVPEQVLSALGEQSRACPAQIEAAVRGARLAGENGLDAQVLERLVHASDRLVTGHRPTPAGVWDHLPCDVLNAGRDLGELLDGLAGGEADCRILCAGPPGVGKSHFGRQLARRLDRPLVSIAPSDLLSRWVGESEERIARAFAQAADERAVLLFDEVDSFLFDRGRATHRWETSLVNEFLMRLEHFPGQLVATTNRLEALDPAVLRRFDLKLSFGYPDPEQCLRLFARYFEPLLGRALDEGEKGRVRAEAGASGPLAPGDFPVVARRARLVKSLGVGWLLAELGEEAKGRGGGKARVGF